MEEIWKDIKGYEGLYQVSNTGKVRSFQRWKRASCPDEYLLNPTLANNGYMQVTLYKSTQRKKFLVHRLVADAFVPNPGNLPHINHIDECRANNNADNLEWCTPLYNNRYGTAMLRSMITRGAPVSQHLVNGQTIAIYATVGIASKFSGVHSSLIQSCVHGKCHSAGGYIWKTASM